MDYELQRYVNLLTESENMEPDDSDEKYRLRESIEKMDFFEDRDMSRQDMARKLTVNEEDIDTLFSILSKGGNAQDILNDIDEELVFNGLETVDAPDNEKVHYLRNGDLYKDTIIYYNGKYYIGSIGSLLESDFDLNRITRIK